MSSQIMLKLFCFIFCFLLSSALAGGNAYAEGGGFFSWFPKIFSNPTKPEEVKTEEKKPEEKKAEEKKPEEIKPEEKKPEEKTDAIPLPVPNPLRQAEEAAKIEAEKKAEEAKKLEAELLQKQEAKKAEEARLAEEAQKKKIADELKKEEERKAKEAKDARDAEEARKKKEAEEKKKEEARLAKEAKDAEIARKKKEAEEKKKAEEERKKAENERKAEEARKAKEEKDAREAEAARVKKEAEDAKKAAAPTVAPAPSSGSPSNVKMGSGGDATKFPIKIKVTVRGIESGTLYDVGPEKKYSLSVLKLDEKRSKVKLYEKSGAAKDGEYWIGNYDLIEVTNKSIFQGLKSAASGATQQKPCCDVLDDPSGRAEPTPEPPTVVKPAPVPVPVAPPPVEPKPDQPVASSAICDIYQKYLKMGVPKDPLKQALSYYDKNKSKFKNDRYVSIGDYSQNSRKKRFYLLDMKTGELTNEKVSHGSGLAGGKYVSDSNNDGNVDRCEHPNKKGKADSRKNMTRPGFFRMTNLDFSSAHAKKWPRITKGTNSLLLEGLSGDVNKRAGDQGVKMHEAYYNHGGDAQMGKSFGCPAFVPGKGAPIMKKIQGGSLYYSYVPVCKSDMDYVYKRDIPDWQKFCEP